MKQFLISEFKSHTAQYISRKELHQRRPSTCNVRCHCRTEEHGRSHLGEGNRTGYSASAVARFSKILSICLHVDTFEDPQIDCNSQHAKQAFEISFLLAEQKALAAASSRAMKIAGESGQWICMKAITDEPTLDAIYGNYNVSFEKVVNDDENNSAFVVVEDAAVLDSHTANAIMKWVAQREDSLPKPIVLEFEPDTVNFVRSVNAEKRK